MIRLLTWDVLVSLPIFAICGGVCALLRGVIILVYRLILRVRSAIRERKSIRGIREWIDVAKTADVTEIRSSKSVIDIVTIIVSALLFPLVSYILLDGVIRLESIAIFTSGLIFADLLLARLLKHPESFFTVIIIHVMYAVCLAVSQGWRFVSFVMNVLKKASKNPSFFTKSDKKQP